jgi:hypothetical protein
MAPTARLPDLAGAGHQDIGATPVARVLDTRIETLLARALSAPSPHPGAAPARRLGAARPGARPLAQRVAVRALAAAASAAHASPTRWTSSTPATAPGAPSPTRQRRVCGKPIALLLHGETGTGKELFARAVHAARRAATALRGHQLRRHARAPARGRAVRPRAPAPSPARARRPPGRLRRPTAAPCSSTRSATCRWPCRPGCCACCRSAGQPAGRRRQRGGRFRVVCATHQRPARPPRPAASAPTCTTGSTA